MLLQAEELNSQTTLSSPRKEWHERRSLFSLPFFDQAVRANCPCSGVCCVCVTVELSANARH